MTELRNVEADLSRFRARALLMAAVVLVCFGLVVARLVWLQVVRHDELAERAESNRTAIVPIVPNRGLILDRNGVVLATNYSAYTLEITPSRLTRELDETIDALAAFIDIQPRDRRRFREIGNLVGFPRLETALQAETFPFELPRRARHRGRDDPVSQLQARLLRHGAKFVARSQKGPSNDGGRLAPHDRL